MSNMVLPCRGLRNCSVCCVVDGSHPLNVSIYASVCDYHFVLLTGQFPGEKCRISCLVLSVEYRLAGNLLASVCPGIQLYPQEVNGLSFRSEIPGENNHVWREICERGESASKKDQGAGKPAEGLLVMRSGATGRLQLIQATFHDLPHRVNINGTLAG